MNNEKSNREKLDDMLIEIQGQIGNVDSGILFEKLEEISKYRPLTSLYFNTLAELYYSEKRYQEALSILGGKENWCHPSPYAAASAGIISKSLLKGDLLHSNMYKNLGYYLSVSQHNDVISKQQVKNITEELLELQEKFQESTAVSDCVTEMFYKYTELWCFVEAAIMLLININYLDNRNVDYQVKDYIADFKVFDSNLGYIFEQLMSKDNNPFILIADSNNNYLSYTSLAKALVLLGKRVILIAQLIPIDVDYPISINDTVAISMENIEIIDGYELVHPIEVICNEISQGDNTILLAEHIVKMTEDDYANLITSRDIFDFLSDSTELNMRVQCLSSYRGESFNNFLGFGYLGKYVSYINRIYNINYIEEISQKSDYKFSIVIPARNSAYTLQYTLKTCLEQRGMTDKDYEIIISDNSTNGNREIYDLVQAYNDKKIKYFKTPRDLPLNRSFEFAFSKARGEMIIPIGSDDGILPWGLETLSNCMVNLPEEDVFAWHRGFFQWSESESSQAGKFVIPRFYKKSEYNIDRYDCKKALKTLMDNTETFMYTVPTLYINSGFRRRYLNKILEKTGRLWDGYTQDIYMSIVNLLINDGFIFMEYPITIAGMSDNSLGAKSGKLCIDNSELQIKQAETNLQSGFGNTVVSRYKFEGFGLDTSMFWSEIYRLLENKSLYKELMPLLKSCDWESIFTDIISKYNPFNLDYSIQINVMRSNAYSMGQDIGKLFDSVHYKAYLEKIYLLPNTKDDKEKYFTGFNNSLTLDAKKFGVYNIYEAAKLFENLVNL